jgi:hypothetical protein
VERLARPFNPEWLFQSKDDGYRGVLYLAPRLALITSKRNNVLVRCQPLSNRLQGELEVRSVILRWSNLDSEGHQDFQALM